MSQLSTFYPAPITAADLGLGAGSNATFGSVTTGAGTFTTLNANTQIVGPQGTAVGSSSTPAFSIGASNSGIYVAGNQLIFTQGGTDRAYFDNTGRFFLTGTGGLSIGATGTGINFTRSVSLNPDATGTLAQRSTTQAQTFQLYNTTDGPLTNFERGFMRWSSNVLQIGTEKGGTGSARHVQLLYDGQAVVQSFASGSLRLDALSTNNLEFYTNGTQRWIIGGSSGALQCADTVPIRFGGSSSSFPRLANSSAVLRCQLADASAYAVFEALFRAQGTAPANATATGTAGDIRYDPDYIYVCTATNTWKRAAIATW